MSTTMTKPPKQTNGKTANPDEGWEKAPSSSLPPFCIPDVGDTVRGIFLGRVVQHQTERKKVKGKWVEEEKDRVNYNVKLTAASSGRNGGLTNGARVEYQPGEVVTVPGAGALDRSIDLVALALAGKDKEDADGKPSIPTDADYALLTGREFRITRMPDAKMKGGLYKGKPVKVYDVEHRALPS